MELHVLTGYKNNLFHNEGYVIAFRSDLAWFRQLAVRQVKSTRAFVTFGPLELTGNNRAVTDSFDCVKMLVYECVLRYATLIGLFHFVRHQGVTLSVRQVKPKIVSVALKGDLRFESRVPSHLIFTEDGLFWPVRLHNCFVAKHQGFWGWSALSLLSGLSFVL